jgi:hypothetical protein
MDLKNPKWMYTKAGLFIVIGITCFGLILIDQPNVFTALLMLIMIWAFARAYYFAFYVIEHYVDVQYRFSGLFSFLRYLMSRRMKKDE